MYNTLMSTFPRWRLPVSKKGAKNLAPFFDVVVISGLVRKRSAVLVMESRVLPQTWADLAAVAAVHSAARRGRRQAPRRYCGQNLAGSSPLSVLMAVAWRTGGIRACYRSSGMAVDNIMAGASGHVKFSAARGQITLAGETRQVMAMSLSPVASSTKIPMRGSKQRVSIQMWRLERGPLVVARKKSVTRQDFLQLGFCGCWSKFVVVDIVVVVVVEQRVPATASLRGGAEYWKLVNIYNQN